MNRDRFLNSPQKRFSNFIKDDRFQVEKRVFKTKLFFNLKKKIVLNSTLAVVILQTLFCISFFAW